MNAQEFANRLTDLIVEVDPDVLEFLPAEILAKSMLRGLEGSLGFLMDLEEFGVLEVDLD